MNTPPTQLHAVNNRAKAYVRSLGWLLSRTPHSPAAGEGFLVNTVIWHSNVDTTISPCGICRQVLREFCTSDMPILLVPGDYPQKLEPGKAQKPGYTEGGVKETTLGELLPDSFGEQLDLLRK